MISSITRFYTSTQQRAIQIVSGNEFRELTRKTARVGWEVLKVAIALKFNPYCALLALGVGLLFPEVTHFKLDRIAHLVDSKKRFAIPILFAFTVVFLPVAALGASFYIGARMGSRIMLMDVPMTAVEDKN